METERETQVLSNLLQARPFEIPVTLVTKNSLDILLTVGVPRLKWILTFLFVLAEASQWDDYLCTSSNSCSSWTPGPDPIKNFSVE